MEQTERVQNHTLPIRRDLEIVLEVHGSYSGQTDVLRLILQKYQKSEEQLGLTAANPANLARAKVVSEVTSSTFSFSQSSSTPRTK